MHRKGGQLEFNNCIHAHSNDVDPGISLPGQYDINHYPTAATYHHRPEAEVLLPRNIYNPAQNAPRNNGPRVNLPPLVVNLHWSCGSHCSCCQSSSLFPQGDSGSENVHPTPSPQLHPYSRYPSTTDTNPSGASMSDIEVAVPDEEGQNLQPHGLGASSRLSGHSGTNRPLNLNYPPNDNNALQPVSPSTSNTRDIERCTDQCCSNEKCRWHLFLDQYPYLIEWQVEVQTIKLKKSSNESFGFSFKTKRPRNLDNMFVMVDRVKRNGKAAREGLAVGDMIHSINGKPLQTGEKFETVDIKNPSELKMQIQRPLSILEKAHEILKAKNSRRDQNMSQAVEPKSPSMSPDQAPVMEKSPFESIHLSTMRRAEPRPAVTSQHLPQVRVFLCGNCTLDFVRCILRDLITITADGQPFTYQISMEKTANGNVEINNYKAYSCMSNSPISCINVEVIAVLNDNFFHNCCPWMFTPESVFIMTFDTKKLSLSNDTEMARLSNLAHTILTNVNTNLENLRLFGIKPAGDDVRPEEVQTLFHTYLAASLPQPKIVSLQAANEVAAVEADLFNFFGQLCLRRTVLSTTNYVIDQLISSPNMLLQKRELYHVLPEGVSTSPEANQFCDFVLKDLLFTGNLKEFGGRILSEEQREFVIPCKFFDCLSKLIQLMDRDPDIWNSSPNFPGLLREHDLYDLISKVTPFTHKTIFYLREMNIMFPVKVHGRDSGFCEGASFFFPYFVKDFSTPIEGDACQELFMASNITPVSAFFHLLSDLSLQEKCVITAIESQSLFRISYDGQELLINLNRGKNEVGIFIGRNQKPVRQQTLRELSDLVEKALSHYSAGLVVCKEPCSKTVSEIYRGANSQSIENNEAVAGQLPDTQNTEEQDYEFWNQKKEEEQGRILTTPVVQLIRLHNPLQMLYEHMTINENWEKWAAILGLSTENIAVYRSLVRNRRALQGATFYEEYTLATRCPLNTVIESLREMSQTDGYCRTLAEELWKAAWENNAVWPPPM